MKQITLSNGGIAMLDDADYEALKGFHWYRMDRGRNSYAIRKIRENKIQRNIAMHREILGLDKGWICDHADGNGLNNSRANLRTATAAENSRNSRKHADSKTSRFKGVYWNKPAKKFMAQIHYQGKQTYLGLHESEIAAALAYNAAASSLFGAFALLNEITQEDPKKISTTASNSANSHSYQLFAIFQR